MKAHGPDVLIVTGIRIETGIGYSKHEQGILQPLDVDLEIEVAPIEGDDAGGALDYRALKNELRRELLAHRFDLIESVAQVVAGLALDRPQAQRVTVTVHKPGALTGAADVAVRITRSR